LNDHRLFLCLGGTLNAIIPSELPFLDVEAIVAEIVSMAVLIQVSLKLSASLPGSEKTGV